MYYLFLYVPQYKSVNYNYLLTDLLDGMIINEDLDLKQLIPKFNKVKYLFVKNITSVKVNMFSMKASVIDNDLINRLKEYNHICLLEVDVNTDTHEITNREIRLKRELIDMEYSMPQPIKNNDKIISTSTTKTNKIETKNLKVVDFSNINNKNKIMIVKNFNDCIINEKYYKLCKEEIDIIKQQYFEFIKTLNNLNELSKYSNFIIILKNDNEIDKIDNIYKMFMSLSKESQIILKNKLNI